MLVSEAWNLYKADKQIQGYSSQTLKVYKVQMSLLIKYFGDIKITDITTESIKLFLGEVAAELKASSLCHRIRFIKSLFKWAQEEKYVSINPVSTIKEPKPESRIPKFLTEEEIELLREACKTTFEKALFEFMYSTGCRIGEVVNLDKHSINMAEQSVIVFGKGKKEREVYFNTQCSIWLKRYLEERADDQQALFVTIRAPHRMNIAQMRYVIKQISKRSRINKCIHPHQLRHSYATTLINNGAPLEVIQNLMGHEKSETTRVYAYLSGHLRRELYKKFF
ncbi:tyrosine-type recombinase/integrase [Bacillus sp. CMF12]|uniref:tyrosine-type recombinase/integrase n=1 Tax=Bacillus sp. CMF12 TaxID=2884834 RepID=UPI00207AF3DE|nr:tyrosine-type recombinase/integrase [Bacillus sp. CMF12]USK50570.1 tyrosine-type recombinase/integrase [Bacillus sp. CMF12]